MCNHNADETSAMAVLGNQTFLMALTCGLFYFLKALTSVDFNLQLYIQLYMIWNKYSLMFGYMV